MNNGNTTRRKFLTGLGGLVFAPAIVRAENIMPVRSPPLITSVTVISPGSGYKVATAIDSGLYYCPYVPLYFYDTKGNITNIVV